MPNTNKPIGWLSPKEYKEIYNKVPRLCVDIIILNDNGFVLTKRNIEPHKGEWHLPGGGVRYGELIEEAIKRILMKETNIEPEIVNLIGYIDHPDEDSLGYGWPISFVFTVKVKKGKLSGSVEGEEIGIFSKAPENTLLNHKAFLDNLFKVNQNRK